MSVSTFFDLNQIGHNSVNFKATTSRFGMVVDLKEEDKVEEVDDDNNNDDDHTSNNVFLHFFAFYFFALFAFFVFFAFFIFSAFFRCTKVSNKFSKLWKEGPEHSLGWYFHFIRIIIRKKD